MPTEVKICGLSDEEGVDAALQAGADFIGLVLFPPSPRNVSLKRAATLATRARGRARVVVMTVDGEDSLLAEVAVRLRPDVVQLHGKESPQRLRQVRDIVKAPVMKAIGVSARTDLASLADYAADRLLLDAKPPKDANRPGGHGLVFDWAILEGFAAPAPWFLSGGLHPSNVATALAATGAPGVDVSSGVESAPGRKDPALICAFIDAVRNFERQGGAQESGPKQAKQEERAA